MEKMKKFIALFLLMFFTFISLGNFVFAANCGNSVGITTVGIDLLSNPNDCPDLSKNGGNNNSILADTLGKKINTIIKVILGFSATIGLVAFVFAGLKILLSNGDPKAYKDGTDIIKYTFMGILIIIFSYAIVNFLTKTIPNITKGTGVVSNDSGSTSSYIENGDYCNGTGTSALGKCYYLLKAYIDSNDNNSANGYPADWNKVSSVCGREASFCKTENGNEYCLRCVDKTKSVPSEKIYNPTDDSNKKPL